MRKLFLAALAATGAAIFSAGSAEAAPYRYCLVESFEAGPGTCYYNTYAQCMMSASGRRAYCQLNPVYAFAGEPRAVKPRKVRRHRHH